MTLLNTTGCHMGKATCIPMERQCPAGNLSWHDFKRRSENQQHSESIVSQLWEQLHLETQNTLSRRKGGKRKRTMHSEEHA